MSTETPASVNFAILGDVSANLKTQDNAITADPMFVVFEKQLIAGVGDGFAEDWMWVTADDGEHSEADHEMAVILERLRDDGEPLVIGRRTYEKLGLKRVDKFCAAFLTRKGAEDYLAVNAHNLTQPFIYIEGMYRNAEMITVRNYFLTHYADDALEPDFQRLRDHRETIYRMRTEVKQEIGKLSGLSFSSYKDAIEWLTTHNAMRTEKQAP